MEQQQYKMNSNYKPPMQRGHFRRIWGPLLIKWGIGILVSIVAAIGVEVFVMFQKTGVDITSANSLEKMMTAWEQYMASSASNSSVSLELAQEVTDIMTKYVTPIEGVSAFITIPIMMVMFHRDTLREKLWGIIPNKKAAIWKYIGVIVMSLALTLGLNNLIQISGIEAVSSSYEETMTSLYSASFLVQIICLGILIPICEEMVFRGLMFRRVRESSKFLSAALYSTAIFALLHVNIVQMLYAFALGMVFCYLYEKYGSVKAPILAHIVSNVLSVILTQYTFYEKLTKQPMAMGIVTVVCAAVASTAYVLIQRIEEKPEQPEKTEESPRDYWKTQA